MKTRRMILLVGRSGSGKDANVMANGYQMVVSNTTRPPRVGELDGVKYHFHPESTPFPDESTIIAKTIKCGYKYWVTTDDLYEDGKLKECFIIDHKGVEFLRTRYDAETFSAMFVVVVIDCPYRILFRNLRKGRKESLRFVIRRMLEDVIAFAGAKRRADLVLAYVDGWHPDIRRLIEEHHHAAFAG